VTDQILAQEAIRTNERNLKLFIEYAPTGIAMLDRDMCYIAASGRFLEDYGLEHDDLIGHSHYEIFPDMPERWKEIHQRCLAGAIEKADEDQFTRADGSVHWLRWEIHPWYDTQDKIGGIILYHEMITERKRMEEALQANARQIQILGDHLPNGAIYRYVQTASGGMRFELMSAGIEDITGVPVEEILQDASALHKTIFVEDLEHMIPIENDSRDALAPFEFELRQRHRVTGKTHWSLLRSLPYRRADGSTVWDGIQLDITQRKLAEEELDQAHRTLQDYAERLQRSNSELEQFAFVASHDMQEPLRKIRLFGSRLQPFIANPSENPMSKNALDFLNRMLEASERMQAMIDGLLELSRINTSKENFQPTQLNQLLEDVINDLEPRLQASGGQVILGDLFTVEVDAMQIRRLFLNLIGNALKFHRPGVPPLVEISATLTRSTYAANGGSQVVIRVSDNGIGFEQQYAERIFQPFQRLHGRSEYDGTGLGLSICQRIVDRHHGKIEAAGQPGQGATFTITLPCEQAGHSQS